ncbi:hypothetical protein ACXWN7_10645, partial [Streptococcus pyogenes]
HLCVFYDDVGSKTNARRLLMEFKTNIQKNDHIETALFLLLSTIDDLMEGTPFALTDLVTCENKSTLRVLGKRLYALT